MRRHLIAGALACFGSSLLGQAPGNTAIQPQGTLNNVPNTVQDGLQKAQDTVDRNVPQSSASANLGDGQNRALINGENQVNQGAGSTGNAGVQSNTNLQNSLDRQPGQLNSNLSTQVQGQSTLGGQQRNGALQDGTNQYGSTYQENGNSGPNSTATQRQNQSLQSSQLSNQAPNAGALQNNGSMQNMPMTPMWNSSQNSNMQQPWSSQSANRVYMLRFDANGREFICVNGRSVYFDNVNSVSPQVSSGIQNQYRAGYGNYDLKNGQNTQDQSRQVGQPRTEQQNSRSGQNAVGDITNSQTVGPDSSSKTTNGSDVISPDRDSLSSDRQNDPKARQIDGETQSDINAKTDVVNPTKTLNDVADPKL